jgi:hypothetical protein
MLATTTSSETYNQLCIASNQIAGYLILKAAWLHMWGHNEAALELLATVRRSLTADMEGSTLIYAQNLSELIVDPRFHPSALGD